MSSIFKHFSVAVTFAILAFTQAAWAQGQFASGSGVDGDPWIIETPGHLANVQLYLGSANSDKHFKLGADIDLGVAPYNSGTGWTPIGDIGWFTGTFDGDGKTISNLYINNATLDYAGLFGKVDDVAKVANVKLENVNITARDYVGGLVGYNAGEITDSYATGSVGGNDRVGGLVGDNNGSSSSITYSYATGSVSGNNNVGGLVGENANFASITHSYATGSVSGNNRVGGLVGDNGNDAPITNSYSTGSVSGNNNVGGLAGSNYGASITHSYATGSVSGNGDGVGGLVGLNYGNASITDSYATGSVSGIGFVGGLVGGNGGSVENSAALNPSVNGNANVGRVVGSSVGGGTLASNIAFSGMSVTLNNVPKSSIGNAGNHIDGASKTRAALYTSWPLNAIQTADLPSHLQPQPLTIIVPEREYNGTNIVELTGSVLQGIIDDGGEVFLTLGSTTGTMDDANAGLNKPVTASGLALDGADIAGYTLEQPTSVMVVIKPKPITITGVSAEDRDFKEDNLTVELKGGALVGVLAGDEDNVGFALGMGSLTSASAGENKPVATFIVLTGTARQNYTLVQPTGITVNINSTTPILPTSHLSLTTSHSPLYYTLKGEPLGATKPTVPGVYIEKRPGVAKRIVVR